MGSGEGGRASGQGRRAGWGGAWTTRSCRTNSAPHSQERRPAGSVAEGPQPPPERRSGLGKAESGIAAHISGGGGSGERSGAHFYLEQNYV